MLTAVNDAVGDTEGKKLSERRLDAAFDDYWHRFEQKLEDIKNATYEDELSDKDRVFDLIHDWILKALTTLPENGVTLEELIVRVAGVMQGNKAETLDIDGLVALAGVMRSKFLPRMIRTGISHTAGRPIQAER